MAREKQARGEHRDHAVSLDRSAVERDRPRAPTPGKSTLNVGGATFEPRWEVDFRIGRARDALAELAHANRAGDARRSTLAARDIVLHLDYAREAARIAADPARREALVALELEAKPLIHEAFIPSDGAMRAATRWSGDRSCIETEAARWVQLRSTGMFDRPADANAIAARGVANARDPLPFASTIQRAFGRHDVSSVRVAIGGPGANAARALGAAAYAAGDRVAFATTPDLHTAAHEAAHVIQQRAGVNLAGGIGRDGDEYERAADAVADAVVGGRSAEAILDVSGGGGSRYAVQRKPGEPKHALPGAMITVTLFDSSWRFVTKRVEPLVGDSPGDVLAGEIEGDTIRWAGGGEFDVELGDKIAKDHLSGGVALARWAKQVSGGKALYVKVEVNASIEASTKTSGESDVEAHMRSDENGTATGRKNARKKPSNGEASIGNAADTHKGNTAEAGHRGEGAIAAKHMHGQSTGAAAGSADHAANGGPNGRSDGNVATVGYFYDPDHAHRGTEDVAPDNADVDGMAGGEGNVGDHGVPDAGALALKVPVPRKVAAAVTLGIILSQVNVESLCDQLIKSTFKAGAETAAEELAAATSKEVQKFVDGETATFLKEDRAYVFGTANERAQIAVSARAEIDAEARRMISETLDHRIETYGRATVSDALHKGEFAADAIASDTDLATAAARTKAALPESTAVDTAAASEQASIAYEVAAAGGGGDEVFTQARQWSRGKQLSNLQDEELKLRSMESRVHEVKFDPGADGLTRRQADKFVEEWSKQVAIQQRKVDILSELIRRGGKR